MKRELANLKQRRRNIQQVENKENIMPKYKQFLETILDVLEQYSTEEVKLLIGDSINNNRTLTVNQVIRFLKLTKGKKKFSGQVQRVYSVLRPYMNNSRIASNNRTDAFDINEFVNVYDDYIITQKKIRPLVSNVLKSA